MLLQAQGKLRLAEPFFRRALEGCERTLGPDHPDTRMLVNNTRNLLEGGFFRSGLQATSIKGLALAAAGLMTGGSHAAMNMTSSLLCFVTV